MQRDGKVNPFKEKLTSRQRYAERQIEKFIKWSWDIKGRIRSTDIEQLHKRYNIKCFGHRK